ncbi:hypothetical protein EBU99_13885, partial [bacterium]|nr:hypothetical protein [bacterium]
MGWENNMSESNMHYKTENPRSELFLADESVGFLMLSGSGCSLRKWQGLTVGEMSIVANIQWSFAHSETQSWVREQQWISTERNSQSIVRHWRMDCGCLVEERWDWENPMQGLLVRWTWTDDLNCSFTSVAQGNAKKRANLSLSPQWTLCPAGHHTCGSELTTMSLNPEKLNEILIESEQCKVKIAVKCLNS